MLTEQQSSELKAKHGEKLASVETPLGTLVFKKPTREAYDRWQDGIASGKVRSEIARELAAHCLVMPEHAGFMAILDQLPGILAAEVLDACTVHCGLVDKYEVKKL